jgi:hypothetical protein
MSSGPTFPFPEPFAAWLIVANPQVDKASRKVSLNFLTAPLPNGTGGKAQRVIAIFDSLEFASRFARATVPVEVEGTQAMLRCLAFTSRKLLAVLQSLQKRKHVHGVMHGPSDVRTGLQLHVYEIEQVIATLEERIGLDSHDP